MTELESFEALPLCEPLQSALRDKNYVKPSPIQAQAIPPLLDFRDLLGCAQTGTGKTAAFALPILHHIHVLPKRSEPGRFRALVLTPTRELAAQVGKSFDTYGKHLKTRTALVYGGVGAGEQIRALRRGVDILIATPGRLLDLWRQGRLDFSATEFFVLDEADRMLDMGFIHDIRTVVAELPENRQSLFFSATLSPAITKLAGDILSDPVSVRIAPESTTTEAVNHRLCLIDRTDKYDFLEMLVKDQQRSQGRNLTLVFSRTKHGADRLARQLKQSGVRVEAIHGNKAQNQRERALQRFRDGRSTVMVATDVAARGIDVPEITLVVNYDLPNEAEAYVHRIGRTGRGGAEGCALSFCTGEDFEELHAIEKLIREPIVIFLDHPYHREGLQRKREQLTSEQARREEQRASNDRTRGGRGRGRGGRNQRGPRTGNHARNSGRPENAQRRRERKQGAAA